MKDAFFKPAKPGKCCIGSSKNLVKAGVHLAVGMAMLGIIAGALKK